MTSISATVTTPDGTCPVSLHMPAGSGPWPAVIMYPDAGGVRDTFAQMAARLAAFGYVVLLPDVYYRHGEWQPFSMATAFSDPVERERLLGMAHSVTPDMMASDADSFLDFLASRPEVTGGRFGVCGYCGGGRTALIVSARQPHRVAAVGSFHGGGLAAHDPDSPHLLAQHITATVYVAGAQNDQSFTPQQADLLDNALTVAGVRHKIETYSAAHGFAVPDSPRYDDQAAQRHWVALRDLLDSALPG